VKTWGPWLLFFGASLVAAGCLCVVAPGCSASQRQTEATALEVSVATCVALLAVPEPIWVRIPCVVDEAAAPGVEGALVHVRHVADADAGGP
jgi:hypothetical protein